MIVKNLSAACFLGFVAPSLALGHHSPAAYDLTAEIQVAGTIAEIEWTNPHIYVTVETDGPGEQRRLQRIESDGVAAVRTSGLTREILAPGSRVTFRAFPSRRGAGHTALAVDVTTVDGSVYPLGPIGRTSRPLVATAPADSLAGK
jgi:hypothetical protein